MLLLHLPQALQTAPQVAAPQHDAPKVMRVLALGSASSGNDRAGPMIVDDNAVEDDEESVKAEVALLRSQAHVTDTVDQKGLAGARPQGKRNRMMNLLGFALNALLEKEGA